MLLSTLNAKRPLKIRKFHLLRNLPWKLIAPQRMREMIHPLPMSLRDPHLLMMIPLLVVMTVTVKMKVLRVTQHQGNKKQDLNLDLRMMRRVALLLRRKIEILSLRTDQEGI